MIARNIVLFCFLVGNLTIAPRPDALAAGKAATAPGTYRDWNGDIDEVTILQALNAAGYDSIAVEAFDTAGAVGMFGGGYQELFTRTAHQIGGDIATLINAF